MRQSARFHEGSPSTRIIHDENLERVGLYASWAELFKWETLMAGRIANRWENKSSQVA